MSFRIGVDGGGTKTDCILLDDHGAVAACRTAPGCNPSLVGPERARAVLVEALEALVADAPRLPDMGGTPMPRGTGVPPVDKTGTRPDLIPTSGSSSANVDRVLLCMAGSQSFWRETAAGLEGYGRVETMPDSLPVLELATDGGPGLVVHAGTGSFVAARAPDGSVHYAGGLGWRFGDPASGYDLGRRAIALALLELQEWVPRTALADQLCAHTGLADYTANSRWFYRGEDANATITAFAPRVVELAGQGCIPAQRVIAESLTDLSALVNAVCSRLFPAATIHAPVPCGVSGALLNQSPCWFALCALAAMHAWPVQLRPVTARPIEGVRRLLQKMA
jgi:N-acetylglucosamine kinase-like BadF-type ATPase